MKTAMQELLDELKEYQLEFNIPIEVIDMCESQLNVEKEQMFDFFLKGYSIGESDFNPKSEANKYYNQTYKQEIEKL
jgi:hypothetical protein